MKTLWLAILLFSSARAFADVRLSKPFVWKGTGDFSFSVSDLTMNADFGGSLAPDGSAALPAQGIFHADVRAYGRANVALLLSESDNGVGAIYLLSGSDFATGKPIPVRRVSMKSDFDGVVSRLRELGYGNPIEPLRAYFSKNPNAMFEAYVHELDANLVEARKSTPKEEGQVAQRQTPTPPTEPTDPPPATTPQQGGNVDPQEEEPQTPGERLSPEEQARQDRQAELDQQQREYEQEVRRQQKQQQQQQRQQQEAYCRYYGGSYCDYQPRTQRPPRPYQPQYPGQQFFEGLFGRPGY